MHLVLSVRDLVRQIPAEWQENVKHRSAMSYARFLSRITDPEPQQPDRVVVLERPGDPRDPRPLGRRPAARARPPRHGAVAGRGARPAVEAVLPGFRARGHRPRAGRRAGQPVARRPRDGADPPHQPVGQPACSNPPTTGRWCASCWPTRPCRSRVLSPRLALPPEQVPWVQEREAAFVAEIERRGYDVVGDLHDLRGNPALHPYVDPDRPRERDVAGAAVDAIKALLLDNARLRAEEARLQRRARRDPGGAAAVLPPAVLPDAREGRASAWPAAAPGAVCSASTAWRAAGARGRRSGRSSRSRSRRRPCRRRRPPAGSAG